MKTAWPLLLLVISLAGCAPPAQPPGAQRPLAVIATPTPPAVETPAPTAAPTQPAPTAPQVDCAGQPGCPTPVPAPTSIPQPAVAVEQACLVVEDHLPEDLQLDGALLLYDHDWNNTLYHLDLRSRRKSPFPQSAYGYFVLSRFGGSNTAGGSLGMLSPSGTWLAYFDKTEPGFSDQAARVLRVTSAEGKQVIINAWQPEAQYLLGWQDDRHLALVVPGYPGGDFVTLDPFAVPRQVRATAIPGLPEKYTDYPQRVIPNLDYSAWVMEAGGWDPVWRLADRAGKVLWEGEDVVDNLPHWAPDGQHFAIMGDFSTLNDVIVDWRVLLVGVDGTALSLTNRTGEREALAWSPDGRFLAGWLQLDLDVALSSLPNRLVLIDTQPPRLTDLCFENQLAAGLVVNAPPVWSPDGRYLAIGASRRVDASQNELLWDTLIIDLQTRRAYRLAEDATPTVWLRKPK